MTPHIFGIKNCDTMKKALGWLDDRKITYVFHDYKKSGVDVAVLEKAIGQHGWENVLNRKGTSWRGIAEDVRSSMDATKAVQEAARNPSLIRRPLLLNGPDIYLGFDEKLYETALCKNIAD